MALPTPNNPEDIARQQVVLSLFPGADLLGAAFEELGFCVVRGPDTLWGSDVRDYHVPAGRFDGVIGGPPCQLFSVAGALQKTDAIDLIPEYLRIVAEAEPQWAVMENVVPALKAPTAPDWNSVILRDWDCGGHTSRRRAFWFYGMRPHVEPATRTGKPEYSVLATSWKNRDGDNGFLSSVTGEDAARLQGFAMRAEVIRSALPRFLSETSARQLIVHLMGNGVPRAMGLYVARHVLRTLCGDTSLEYTRLPLFAVNNGNDTP
jgi:DNA (cytosine-5)-methyltransferase 1